MDMTTQVQHLGLEMTQTLYSIETTHMFFLWCKIKALPSKININQREYHTIFHRQAKWYKVEGNNQFNSTRKTKCSLISKCLGMSEEEQ